MLEMSHADAFSQWRENRQGFFGNAFAFIITRDMVNRPHIMGAVSQFDQQNTDVFAHR